MEELRRYIREQVIKEIGEGTTPYSFRPINKNSLWQADYIADYIIDAPTPIKVVLREDTLSGKPSLVIDFYAEKKGKSGTEYTGELTNQGLEVMFRVLTTIKSIVKDYLKTHDYSIQVIEYLASAVKLAGEYSEKKARQRDNLYKAYIQKQFPTAIIRTSPAAGSELLTHIEFNKEITHEDL
jgi:hypothetical protein